MNNLFFFLLLFIAVLIEGVVISIPIVLDVIIIFFILKRSYWLFLPAFVSGIFLDVLSVRALGLSSLFFVLFIFIVALYERKFEIATYPFVFLSSFLGGFLYLLIFGYNHIVGQAIMSSLIAIVLFKGLKDIDNKIQNSKVKSQNYN